MNDTGTYLAQMRQSAPLVQNITNYVAMNVMANVMLAAGASPAMVHARQEAGEFAGIADALSLNIGTPDADWFDAMLDAAAVMNGRGRVWVLDPVAAGATAFRRQACERLLAARPPVIRGNASEVLALAGAASASKGADAGDQVEAAHQAARDLAVRIGGVVAVTGPVDFVTDGDRALHVANGHALMPRVTALGCALTGIVAAFCAVTLDRLSATAAALAYYGLAGQIAGERAAGPGSFQPLFLDALHRLTPADLDLGARITAA
ncbi:hydroxyethylthiazole kinase [Paracoccus sp. M683]|uniref:hydroxyethylthiazole kinase n=1 Tax=Paracoccus sp. M683 TaxID=2594268 RepID=UPI00117C4777|nr:hydroxyethylthiazole kinase [Paracoccus sp. M683]TRW97230.1 hydroxyethylthiazole kinase [Paracoccus sp. M683]